MVCFPSALSLFAFTHVIYLFSTGLLVINVFGEEVIASFPPDFSEIFSPLSALLQRFPAKPLLCVCKQRPTQNPAILGVSLGIFQHLSDVF